LYIALHEIYYIENIIAILLCCNLTITIVYCPTRIYTKGWLTNRLSLPVILNLVSKLSAVRTLLLLFLLAASILSSSSKWTLLLLPPASPTKTTVQPNQPATLKLLPLVLSPTSSSPNLQSRTLALSLMFLSFPCTSWGSWGQRLLLSLHKSLYGLKQAPRAWYTRLSDFLISIGFTASKVDTSLFILSIGADIFYLLVYVDDILLTGSNSVMLHHLIQVLSSEFKLRDLSVVHYFLGIEVQPTAMGLMLRQHKYILDVLTRAGMTSCKPVDTLISTSKVTILSDPLFSDPTRFCQIVGALQYLTFIRPNIYFTVNRVCQFMHAPTDSHWGAVKRILHYLCGTATYGLHITRSSSFALHGLTNADWAGSTDDRKSIGGYLVFFGQTPISWKSSKQRTVARSSTEAEYKALVNGTNEVIWLQYLLRDLQILSISSPILWCDNLGATYLSANPIFHARTKHVEVDYHFVRDRVAKKEIQIRFIPSQDQLADVFTKPLPTIPFTAFRFKLQVNPPPSAWGSILMYYIENILVILLCCNIIITIVYCPTHTHTYIYI